MYYPSFAQFEELAQQYPVVPVYTELLLDFETPPSAYLKVANSPNTGLLESVEGGERLGRYSFVLTQPELVIRTKGRHVEYETGSHLEAFDLPADKDPLHLVQEALDARRAPRLPQLPSMAGGCVGYLGWDLVHFFEELPETQPDELAIWDTYLVFYDTIIVFDHSRHVLQLVHNARIGGNPRYAYEQAQVELEKLAEQLRHRQVEAPALTPVEGSPEVPASNLTKAEFEASVSAAKEYIAAGDIIQVVVSQRLERDFEGDPFSVYRALRTLNPSPYMYYLHCGDVQLIGTSPEVLLTVNDGTARVRPIAGTRPRGATVEDDRLLERELLADEKERAEHVMLVDLGRNDLGRVCEFGSVQVPELFVVERYSHVMHIVSEVRGQLAEGRTELDALRACFPAGTVSGAPKVRAMELIDELEPCRRGAYGGAVGYFSYSGGMDTCITIRTLMAKGGKLYGQAGAGIVADSVPEREWHETLHKARALLTAVDMAQGGSQ